MSLGANVSAAQLPPTRSMLDCGRRVCCRPLVMIGDICNAFECFLEPETRDDRSIDID